MKIRFKIRPTNEYLVPLFLLIISVIFFSCGYYVHSFAEKDKASNEIGLLLINMGSICLGASISRFLILADKNSLLTILRKSLIYNTDDSKYVEPYRAFFHYYWVTKYGGELQWHYTTLDFSEYQTVSKLEAISKKIHPNKEVKHKIIYKVEAFMRKQRLIIIHSFDGTDFEPPCIGVIPYVKQGHDIKMAGVNFLHTYDNTDLIGPVYIDTENRFNINEGVITDLTVINELYKKWEEAMHKQEIHLGRKDKPQNS